MLLVPLLSELTFLIALAESVDLVELLFGLDLEGGDLLFTGLLIDLDPLVELLDGVIDLAGHQGREQVDLLEALADVGMVGEATGLWCIFLLLLFLLLLFLGHFDVFLHFLGDDHFCAFLEFFRPLFVVRRIEFLYGLILLLLALDESLLCVFRSQIVTVGNKSLAGLNLVVMRVPVDIVFPFLLQFFPPLFFPFLPLFITLFLFLALLLSLLELFLFLLFYIFSFFFALFFLCLPFLDLVLFLVHHLDVAHQVEVVLVVVELVEIVVLELIDLLLHLFDLLFGGVDLLVVLDLDLIGSAQVSCVHVLLLHLGLDFTNLASDFLEFSVFLLDLVPNILELRVENLVVLVLESSDFSVDFGLGSKINSLVLRLLHGSFDLCYFLVDDVLLFFVELLQS